MSKIKKDTLHVQGIDVGIYTEDYRNEYISLTDIARYRNSDDPRFAIQNWMRNRNTLEFLGLWESLHNPSFNRVQFDTFRTEHQTVADTCFTGRYQPSPVARSLRYAHPIWGQYIPFRRKYKNATLFRYRDEFFTIKNSLV